VSYVVTPSGFEVGTHEGMTIEILPAWKWLLDYSAVQTDQNKINLLPMLE
jgi:hypothetical protein